MTNLLTPDQVIDSIIQHKRDGRPRYTWQHPADRGQTVQDRLARLWQFVGFYDRYPPVKPGQHDQLARYKSEIAALEKIQDNVK